MDLYQEEKEQALKERVLSKVFLALSREKNIPKVNMNNKKYDLRKYTLLFVKK